MHNSIKERHTKARVAKDKQLTATLTNLLGDLNNKAKVDKVDFVSDKVVIETINTWVKRTKQNIELFKDMPDAKLEAEVELEVYNNLLPTKLDNEAIKRIIAECELDTIPKVMQHFSSNYLGRYDSKEVIAIFNSVR